MTVMATNLEHVATQAVTATPAVALVRSLWERAARSIQSAVCGLHGHDPMLQVHEGRMFLRCTTCGHETPGWRLPDRRPVAQAARDAGRQTPVNVLQEVKRVA